MRDWSIPVKTDWMRKQSSHEPSMEYAKDIHQVITTYFKSNSFNALEIGGAWGFSTLAILEAGATNLMTVDPNPEIEAHNEARANGYPNHEWFQMRSEKFWQTTLSKFDLIYIDGSHLYEDVRNDLYEAWKILNPYGMLLIDDWDHKKNIKAENDTTEYGVSLAAWEFFRDHVWRDVGSVGRVLWFQK